MKMQTSYLKNIGLVKLLSVLAYNLSYAQNIRSFQILDQNNKEPVIGLTYHYGTQKGISDNMGFIYLDVISGQSLQLSHIIYGNWVMDERELLEVFENGILFRKENVLNLQPVSVISLKVAEEKHQKIHI